MCCIEPIYTEWAHTVAVFTSRNPQKMNATFKLAILTVALSTTFAAQASSWAHYNASEVPVVDSGVFGTLPDTSFRSMTTAFSGNGFSGFLRSALSNGTVFYQLFNDVGSTVALSGIQYGGMESFAGYNTVGRIPTVTQTNQAFNIFTAGRDRASLVRTDEFITPRDTWYSQTIDFKGGPARDGSPLDLNTVYGEVLPGITAGTGSYIQMVSAYPTDPYWEGELGYVSINGVGVAAYVGAVPEPETYAMLLAGLGLIGSVARRRKAK